MATKPEVVSLAELIHFHSRQLEATRIADLFKYTLYGGSAGPGKSYWLRWYLLRTLLKWGQQYNLRGIRGVLFSKDFPTLKDRQISKMAVEFPDWLGKIKDTQTDGLGFHVKPEYGGHVLSLRNLDDPSKYLSSEFAIIGMEELTENDEDTFVRVRSRLRWTGIPDPKLVAATNPGGIGHAWVKKRFIDRQFDPNEKEADRHAYVAALPDDNPHLAASYLVTLDSLPEKLRKAYREGNWDSFDGQYFAEWDRSRHVIDPFAVPIHWKRFRSIDHGRSAPTSCHWYAINEDGRIYAYREYYMAGKDADENAKEIARLSEGESYWFSTLDAACWSRTGFGETISEIYARYGVPCTPSPKNRISGWALVHQYLRGDQFGPKLIFFSTCTEAIRTIPTLVHDKHRPEDLDTDGEDHAADDLSYGLQSIHEAKSAPAVDPVMKMLEQMKAKNAVTPNNLSKFYGRR